MIDKSVIEFFIFRGDMNTNEYQTKDLYEASVLYALKQNFLGIKQDGQVCWFIFGDNKSSQRISDLYWARSLNVNAKDYAEAIRTLKERIFSRR